MNKKVRKELESAFGDIIECNKVEQGVNEVYIVRFSDEERVLKLQSDTGIDRNSEAEPEIYDIVNDETNIPSPQVFLKNFSPEASEPYYVMQKITGEKAEAVWPEMSMEERGDVVREYGKILGILHNLRSFSKYGALALEDGEIGVQEGKESWRKVLAERFEIWRESLVKWEKPPDVIVPSEDELTGIVPKHPESVLVHEDNRLDNLILDGSRIKGFLDWSDPKSGPARYDIARAEYLIIDGDTTYAGQEILTDEEKEQLRTELIEGYRQENSLEPGWMNSKERKIYRYAALINISADFKQWSKDLGNEKRKKIRKELVDRLKTEEPRLNIT
jgi:aminoglycoside phosphotransferase (APT) family kinase protein